MEDGGIGPLSEILNTPMFNVTLPCRYRTAAACVGACWFGTQRPECPKDKPVKRRSKADLEEYYNRLADQALYRFVQPDDYNTPQGRPWSAL